MPYFGKSKDCLASTSTILSVLIISRGILVTKKKFELKIQAYNMGLLAKKIWMNRINILL